MFVTLCIKQLSALSAQTSGVSAEVPTWLTKYKFRDN